MADTFDTQSKGLSSPADSHYVISAGATVLNPMPRGIYVSVGGSPVIEDVDGISITYPVAAGAVLPFRATKITALGGATLIAWY